MKSSFKKILAGYQRFRDKYAHGDDSVMSSLASHGQQPGVMIVACCDSRVDPAVILQCAPGELFVIRNVANIIPPCEKDEKHHGTSAALEFGICALGISDLVLLGHSQCGGIRALLEGADSSPYDFVNRWVSLIKSPATGSCTTDDCAKLALQQSLQNCMTFPWIKTRVDRNLLNIHLWFFDIGIGQIFAFSHKEKNYQPLC